MAFLGEGIAAACAALHRERNSFGVPLTALAQPPAPSESLPSIPTVGEVALLWPADETTWRSDPPVAVARVQSGMEGRLEQFLAAHEVIGVCLRYYSHQFANAAGMRRERRTTVKPLFVGTVFVGGGDRGRDAYSHFRKRFGWRHCYGRLDVSPASQFGLRRDLLAAARLVNAGLVDREARCIRPGIKCRVIRGGMMGMVGKYVRREGGDRFVLCVQTIGGEVEAAIPLGDLELADELH